MTTDPAPPPSARTAPTIPPPPMTPEYPQDRPDWVGDLVQEFVNAAVKALDLRLQPVLEELTELRESQTAAEQETRALKSRVRRIEKHLGLPLLEPAKRRRR